MCELHVVLAAIPNLSFGKKRLFPSCIEILSFNTWCLQTPSGNGPLETRGVTFEFGDK